jgi:hypothetical protein
MIELDREPSLWKRWWACSRNLHRQVPSIAIADVDTPVACQLFERVDRVMYIVNASKTARRMVRVYRLMASALFQAGAAGRISAVYYDRRLRRNQPVLLEHWIGRAPPEPEAGVFAFDMGPGFDKNKFRAPDAPLFIEPAEDRDPLQPDRRINLARKEMKPWPGLTLSAVRVRFTDDTPKAPPGRARRMRIVDALSEPIG